LNSVSGTATLPTAVLREDASGTYSESFTMTAVILAEILAENKQESGSVIHRFQQLFASLERNCSGNYRCRSVPLLVWACSSVPLDP
jgi:hypothetical protein